MLELTETTAQFVRYKNVASYKGILVKAHHKPIQVSSVGILGPRQMPSSQTNQGGKKGLLRTDLKNMHKYAQRGSLDR
jgi:hypothetical protein